MADAKATSWEAALAAQQAKKDARRARKGVFDEENAFIIDQSNVKEFILAEVKIRTKYEGGTDTGVTDMDELGRASISCMLEVHFESGHKTYVRLDARYVDQGEYVRLASLEGERVAVENFCVTTTYELRAWSSTGSETVKPATHWTGEIVSVQKV
jgi:hypothetical protein